MTGPRSSSPRACLPPSSRAAAMAAPYSCRAADRETRRIRPTVPQVVLTPEHYNRIDPHPRQEDSGDARDGHPQQLQRRRRRLIQRGRRDAGDRQGRRARHDRRALRFVAHRHRRHGQCGRVGGDDGGDADPQGHRPPPAADGPHGAVDRRRTGLLGSRAHVAATFWRPRRRWSPSLVTRSSPCYFNVDNGSGAIRGVYLQGNEAVAPMFQAWMEPFANLGMTTLTIRNTGGTDHLSFDAVGLPGFQFIQDRARVRRADAPFEHGRLRSDAGRGHDEERGDRRVVRLPRREPRPAHAAKADAEAGYRAIEKRHATVGRPDSTLSSTT